MTNLNIPLTRGEREELPLRRVARLTKVSIGGSASLYIHYGEYPDGRLGEIFLTQAKTGTFNRGVIEGFAVALSLALQYGANLSDTLNTFRHTQFEPQGATNDLEVPTCSSIFDYLAQRLQLDYPNQ